MKAGRVFYSIYNQLTEDEYKLCRHSYYCGEDQLSGLSRGCCTKEGSYYQRLIWSLIWCVNETMSGICCSRCAPSLVAVLWLSCRFLVALSLGRSRLAQTKARKQQLNVQQKAFFFEEKTGKWRLSS